MTKAEMLSRIREALGPSGPAEDLAKPEPYRTHAQRPSAIELTKRFQAELALVGGRSTLVSSSEAVREYVTALAPGGGGIVAVSDGAAKRELELRTWLEELGAKLIPSLREFAAQGGDPEPPADLMEQYKQVLFEADVGITCADYAIADTGTLVISSKRRPNGSLHPTDSPESRYDGEQHRLISLVPPIHVCLLQASSIVSDLNEFFPLAHSELYPDGAPAAVVTFITGPSRTADIELSLTMGVHGPRELHVLISDS